MANHRPDRAGRVCHRQQPPRLPALARALALLLLLAVPLAGSSRAQSVVVPEFIAIPHGTPFDVAEGEDGTLAFIWWTYQGSFTPSNYRVYTAAFTPTGAPAGGGRVDFNGRSSEPAIARRPGGFVAAFWHSPPNDARVVQARLLGPTALPSGDPFVVNDGVQSVLFPSVTALTSGTVFAWLEGPARARIYGPQFQPLTEVFDVSSNAGPFDVHTAPMPGGGFVALWRDFALPGLSARIFDATGTALGPQFAASSAQASERLGSSPTGTFAVIGNDGGAVVLNRFEADGQAIGTPILVNAEAPTEGSRADVQVDFQGNLMAVWSSYVDGIPNGPVRLQVFESVGGQPVSSPLLLAASGNYPRLLRLANGNFLAAWAASGGVRATVLSVCGLGSPTCGDGAIDPPCEVCDDGAGNSDTQPNACRTTCRNAACGDGVTDAGEECDDGNRDGDDGCDQNCLIEFCGNGRQEASEDCDDGNTASGDGCDANCTVTGCGNQVLTGVEECDDGNAENGDGCDDACLLEACPSNRVEGDEECDDGNAADGDGCDANCTNTRCGNGTLTPGEECDDGNGLNGDGCDLACLLEECGNGRREGNEACDDGNLEDGDGCQASCTPTPQVNAALQPLQPLNVILPAGIAETSRTIRAVVRNADSVGLQILRLTAADGTCPAGTVASAADFSPSIDGAQDSVALTPGQRATARLRLRFSRADFAGLHARAPRRCQIDLTLSPANGAVDGSPANDAVRLTVDVFDREAPGTGVSEAHVRNPRALTVRIPVGLLAFEKDVTLRARSTQSDAAFAFNVADGDCPPGTTALLEQDAAGRARVRLRLSRAFFTTPNALSPARCTAEIVTTTGNDLDPTNNSTHLQIDVVDGNDL